MYYCTDLNWRSTSPLILPIIIYLYANINWLTYLRLSGKLLFLFGLSLSLAVSLHRTFLCDQRASDFVFMMLGFILVQLAGVLISWVKFKSKK